MNTYETKILYLEDFFYPIILFKILFKKTKSPESDIYQGSKGIRNGPINWCTFTMKTHTITPFIY